MPGGDDFASDLRGFGPLGIGAILIIIVAGTLVATPLGAALALAWTYISDTPWREIGYVRPRSWMRDLAVGVIFGVAFKLVLKIIVMPVLGAPAINPAYHYLVGNQAAIPATLLLFTVGAGIGEETLFRGYAFERLGKLLGPGTGARVFTVIFTAVLFGAAHYHEQGLPGAEQAVITGLVFGSIYALTGRLWMVMCAHAAFDLAAYAIIYCNLESDVAHLLFR